MEKKQFILKLFIGLLFLVGSFLFSGHVSATIVDADVLQYYPLDGEGNASLYEYSTSSETYMLTRVQDNGKTTTIDTDAGKFGGAIYSSDNGGNSYNEACYYSHSKTNDITGQFAFSFWYKTSNTNSYGHVFSNYDNGVGRYDLRNSGDTAYWSLYDGSNWRDIDVGGADKDGAWHNIVIQGTYGSLGTDSQTYLDGTLVKSNWGGSWSPSIVHQNHLSLGGQPDSGAGQYCKYGFQGYIDDWASYNRKLTTDEITSLQSNPLKEILDPSTYCGDGICNGTETFDDCSDDCPPSATIYWAGVGSQYGEVGSNWNIPFYFNVCSDYGSIDSVSVNLCRTSSCDSSDEKTLIYDKSTFIGPQQCSGIRYFDSRILDTSSASGTSTLRLFIGVGTTTHEVDSSVFNYSISAYDPGVSAGNFIKSLVASPLRVAHSSATTTAVSFLYDLEDLDITNSDICFQNATASTTTGYCFDVATSTGLGTINIPNPETPMTLMGSFVWVKNGGIYLESSQFQLLFYGGYKPPILERGFCEQDGANIFEDTWCYIADGVITPALNFFVDQVSTIFPFVLVKKVSESWEDSATADLPVALEFLDATDVNGNLAVDLPDSWRGNASSSFVVFGPAMFTTNSAMAGFFGSVRDFSTYLFYFLFLFAVYTMGKKVYLEIRE